MTSAKNMENLGTLYGVGVGPGDPDLLTLKGLKVLQSVSTIFAASSTSNDYSIALDIVRHHIGDTPKVERLPFPMSREREKLQKAWRQNARTVLDALEKGEDAAFITLGDPCTYSTFGYLMKEIRRMAPNANVVTVPGVTSYSAAAARLNLPLTEGEESCHLISGATGRGKLKEAISQAENVVILKTYRYFDDIYQALDELELLDRAVLVSKVGLGDEMVARDLRDLRTRKEMPYLSLMIVKKNNLAP